MASRRRDDAAVFTIVFFRTSAKIRTGGRRPFTEVNLKLLPAVPIVSQFRSAEKSLPVTGGL